MDRTSSVTNLQENNLINSRWNDCSYPELSRSLPGCEGKMWLLSKDREALPKTSIMSKTGLWILNLKGWHCLCSLTGVIFTDPANYYLCLCWSRRYVRTKSVVNNMLNTLDCLIDTVRGSLCLFSDFYQMYSGTYYNYIILYSYVLNNWLL